MSNQFITPNKQYMNAGVNEGVIIKDIKFESVPGRYEACAVYYHKDGADLKDMIFPVNPTYVTQIKDKVTGEFIETMDQAIDRNWGYINNKLRSVITNYVTDEQLDAALNKANPTSFEQAVNVYVSLFPINNNIKGRLFCWYKKNGYLEVPQKTSALNGGRVFSVNPDTDMTVKGEYNQGRLTRPVVVTVTDDTTENKTVEANAENLPW